MSVEQPVFRSMVEERWNEAANGFDASPGHGIHSPQEKQIWWALLEEAVGRKSSDILDVGTGTGVIALLLAEMGHKVTGIDLAEKMLDRAREKARGMDYQVKFCTGDAEKIPFDDDTFDVVINRHVFWTMLEPVKAASEWLRVLRPGGRLVIIDGDWHNCGSYKKVWRELANLLTLVTERRNPWGKKNSFREFERQLPLRYEKRPEADLKIFKSLGLEAGVTRFKDPRTYSFLNYLKYGYYERFIVTVIKPTGRVNSDA